MSIWLKIDEKYINAVKSKNAEDTKTLRLVKSAIKNKDIENRTSENYTEINDQQILALLQSLVKQRKDSIDSFKLASRDDLIAKEQLEIDLINQFLPQQLSELQIEDMINKIIEEKKYSSLKDMGNLMNNIKVDHAGSVDLAMVGKIAKKLLGSWCLFLKLI